MGAADLLILFESCNLNGRATLTWEHGSFITSREYYAQKVALYAMPGFYSEVWYRGDQNYIERIEAITSARDLEKYLHLIQIKFDDQ